MDLKKTALALGLVLVMVVGTVTGCGNKLDGTKTAITVNGENVSAGALSLMANYNAALIYSYYGSYMGEGYFDMAAGDIYGDEEEEEAADETAESEEAEATEDAAAEEETAAEEDAATEEDAAAEEEAADETAKEDAEKEDGPTVGDHMVQEAADQLAELVVISQHAEEYGVALTDEEKAAIDEVAQKYVDSNPQEVLKKLGTSKQDMVTLLTLDTIKSKMLPVLAKDVDKNIDDKEAQQSSATIITILYTDEEDAEESADGEDSADENSVTKEQAVADLQKILADINKEADPASCDMNAIAEAVKDTYSATTYTWSTNDPDQTSVSGVIYSAAQSLKDGEVYQQVLVDEERSAASIIRLDKAFDEEATENQKGTIYYQRETDNFENTVKEWVDASDIVKNDKVISTIKITGSQLYTFKQPEEETEEAEPAAEEAEEAEPEAEETEEAEPAAEEAESTEENAG